MSRSPRWRRVWWPQWTRRIGEQRRRAVCGWEEGLRRGRGWRRWETWWPADPRGPAESDSWWVSPHWLCRPHTALPPARPLPAGRWASRTPPRLRWRHRTAVDWGARASTETRSQQCSRCRSAEWRRRREIWATPATQTRLKKGAEAFYFLHLEPWGGGGAIRIHTCSDLNEIVDVYEAAAGQRWLRKRRDDDLLSPLCVFSGFHAGSLHLCDGPQVVHRPLGLIGHFLVWQKKKGHRNKKKTWRPTSITAILRHKDIWWAPTLKEWLHYRLSSHSRHLWHVYQRSIPSRVEISRGQCTFIIVLIIMVMAEDRGSWKDGMVLFSAVLYLLLLYYNTYNFIQNI